MPTHSRNRLSQPIAMQHPPCNEDWNLISWSRLLEAPAGPQNEPAVTSPDCFSISRVSLESGCNWSRSRTGRATDRRSIERKHGRIPTSSLIKCGQRNGRRSSGTRIPERLEMQTILTAGLNARAQALILLGSPLINQLAKPLAEILAAYRIPAISPFRSFPESGGIM